MMTLELYRFDEVLLNHQFESLVSKAPRFFENTPIVVSLEYLENPDSPIDLVRLCSLCAEFGINLIAIRGGDKRHRKSAAEAGLACLSAQPQTVKTPVAATPSDDENDDLADVITVKKAPINNSDVETIEPSEKELNTHIKKTAHNHSQQASQTYLSPRIITTPIRSGQQIHHNGDLIITAPVSPGAEVLAGGNIHAYGPFRGRALAGINGNDNARIYCTHFEAELVSIHGHYKLAPAIDKSLWKKPVQAFLDNDSLLLQLL